MQPAKNECSLHGKVINDAGNPVGYAVIEAKNDKGSDRVWTDKNGEYVINLECHVPYLLNIGAGWHRGKTIENYTLDSESQVANFTLIIIRPKNYYKRDWRGNYYFSNNSDITGKEKRKMCQKELDDEKKLWIAAFKYCFEKYKKDIIPPRYFLYVGSKSVDKKLEQELQQPNMIIKKGSASKIKQRSYVAEKGSGKQGSRIFIYGVTRYPDNRATLYVYHYVGNCGAEKQEIYLELRNGEWVVTGDDVFEVS